MPAYISRGEGDNVNRLTQAEIHAIKRHIEDFNIGWMADVPKEEAQRLHDVASRAVRKLSNACRPMTDRDALKIQIAQEIKDARDRGGAWPVDPDRILAALNPAILQSEDGRG